MPRQEEGTGPAADELTYRQLFHSTIVGVSLTRPDGTFVAVNPAYARMFGYDSPEQLLAEVPNAASLYVDPEGRGRALAPLAREDVMPQVEARMRRRDGAVRWISGSVVVLKSGDGRVAGYHASVFDSTEAREAREQAKRAEAERERIARMYAALSTLNELVTRAKSPEELLRGACEVAVASGNFQVARARMVDRAARLARVVATAGSSPNGAADRPVELFAEPHPRETLVSIAWRTGRPAIVAGAELAPRLPFTPASAVRSAGAYPLMRAEECVGVLVLRSDGADAFEGEMGALLERMARNVSQGLQALAAHEALKRFRLAVDHSGDMMVLVDPATLRYVDVNGTLCRQLGYAREELVGMPVAATVQIPEDELARQYHALLADPQAPSRTLRGHYRRKDGTTFPFESTRRVLRSGEGWLIVGISRDTRERDEAEQALRRKDLFFRSLIENATDMFAVLDAEWCYTYASHAVTRILGFTPEEIVGRKFLDRSIPEDAARAKEILATLERRPGASHVVHLRVPRRDGQVRRLEVVVAVGTDEAGAPAYILTGRDVTERLAAEEELLRREHELRTLVFNSRDIISRWSPDLRLRFVNAAVLRPTGRPAESFLGKTMAEMDLPPAFARGFERALRAVFEGEVPSSVQLPFATPEGAERWFDVHIIPEHGPDGSVSSALGVTRDVTEQMRAEAEVRRREEQFRTLVQNSPDGIMRFDAELRCLFANAAIEKSTGFSVASLLGRSLHDPLVSQEVQEVWGGAIRTALARGEVQTREYSFDGPRGRREYQARFAPERAAGDRFTSVMVISRDVTDRKRAERATAESEARLRGIVEATASPLLLVDRDGITVFANPAAGALFGRTPAELEGAPLGLPLADGRPADVDIVLPDGGTRPAEMQFATTELQGKPLLVVSLHDLSERKHYEQHIARLANHDALTGLPNRTLLRDRVEQAIMYARRTGGHVGLIFVDLDRFKLVNDSYGHVAGDGMLVEVGNRLQKTMREGDTVARLGGDEFVIVVTALASPGDTTTVARKIADALAKPVVVAGQELPVSASLGISLFPGDGDDLDSLLQCADAAMYRAKDAGRNNFQYYSAEMGAQARARVETEAGLRQAIERGELRLHYQPQVELLTGEVTGFEALLRWEHPQRGLVAPNAFIPVAEESGLIVPIGQWALHAACQEAAAWAAAGLGSMKVAVNLSARQFWQGSVTDAVRAALAESGLPAAQLEVEITESVVARDLDQVMRALEQLRRMGVSVAIDDFGTGYSSLAYLRALPIQKLKIDRSFIKGIPADPEATALVGEIVRLAHVLSLNVVAEGVETQAQAAYLRDAGCEGMQGFLFSRPVPAAECALLLRSKRRFNVEP